MIRRKGTPPKASDSAAHAPQEDGISPGHVKENGDCGDRDPDDSGKFATKVRIELLEALKLHVRRGCPMDTAVWIAADACDAEPTPFFARHAVDFLSGSNRYGIRSAEDFYRLFSPNVKRGISL